MKGIRDFLLKIRNEKPNENGIEELCNILNVEENMSSYKNTPMNLDQAIGIINELEEELKDIRQFLDEVLCETCQDHPAEATTVLTLLKGKFNDYKVGKFPYSEQGKLRRELKIAKEANVQCAEKIKLLDLQRKHAEYKLKDVLSVYKNMKDTLKVLLER